MEYILVGILIIFLIFLFLETRRKSQRVMNAVTEEKRQIADDSGITASIGVFTPDSQTTVIIGASEELGVFYYRMLKQAKVITRSRINLANLARIEFLLDGKPQEISIESSMPTTQLCATDIADRVISQYSHDSIRQIQKAALRIIFYDDIGTEKTLDITTLRSTDERHKFERVQLLKNTIWWTAFLSIASRKCRSIRANLEKDEEIGLS